MGPSRQGTGQREMQRREWAELPRLPWALGDTDTELTTLGIVEKAWDGSDPAPKTSSFPVACVGEGGMRAGEVA